MKKLTLLCMASEKDATLEALRSMGVLHVTSVTPPEGKALDQARSRFEQIRKVLNALPVPISENASGKAVSLLRRSKASGPTPPKQGFWLRRPDCEGWNLTAALPTSSEVGTDVDTIIEQVSSFIQRRKELTDSLEKLSVERRRLEPLGDFDPEAVKALAERGVSICLYHASPKAELAAPEGAVLHVLSRDQAGVYFAVIGREDTGAVVPSSWEVFRLPEKSLGQVQKEIMGIEQEFVAIDAGIKALAEERKLVEGMLLKTEENVEYLEVSSGMGSAESIAYLQGFCPKDSVKQVQAVAAEQGWGVLIEEPGADDTVPTLLHYPKWVKPLKALFDIINILPGYREIDVSAVFLLFFSVFFAMLIGDAGYGFLFLVVTLLARMKLKRAPAYPFVLLGILSICTMTWGVLTGNYFGITSLPAPLKALNIDWLNDNNHLMGLCFFIGAVHLSIAHIWNAIRVINTPQAIAQVGWILVTWTMVLAARYFVLNIPFPSWGWAMFGTGMLAVILFMTPAQRLKREFINHAILPLNVVSNFVDVISYLRLFAVGMATLYVAQNFNDMAMALGFSRVWSAPIAALILLAGHTMNILLCALAVLVHGIRLNTLEFSIHIGLAWAGFQYNPFRAKT